MLKPPCTASVQCISCPRALNQPAGDSGIQLAVPGASAMQFLPSMNGTLTCLPVTQVNALSLALLYSLVACMLLLALMWWSKLAGLAVQGGGLLQMQQTANIVSVFLSALVLAIPLCCGMVQRTFEFADLCSAMDRFGDWRMETLFVEWFSSFRLIFDGLVHCVWLLLGSVLWKELVYASASEQLFVPSIWLVMVGAVGPMLPSVLLLCLCRRAYLVHREQVLLCTRVSFTVVFAWCTVHGRVSSDILTSTITMTSLSLAQLASALMTQVRWPTFCLSQTVHVATSLVLAWGALGAVRFVAVGLVLPCLLLYGMEAFARKRFIAALSCDQVPVKSVL